MSRTIRFMYITIEINLVIWLVMMAQVFHAGSADLLKPTAIAGFAFSALAQHWAYYAMRKSCQSKSSVA